MPRDQMLRDSEPQSRGISFPLLSELLSPTTTHDPSVVREREILRLAATLGKNEGDRTGCVARDEILKWAQKRAHAQLPQAAWKHEGFEYLAGGRNCAAVRIDNDDCDIWAIRTENPDTSIAQRTWVTEAIVGQGTEQRVLLSVRLLVSSPEQELQIYPAVPGLVQQLGGKCGLYLETGRLDADPWVIYSEDDGENLIEMLIDPKRRVPVFVLSVPKQSHDPARPLIDPVLISRATLGIAKVVILPERFTWILSERFGRHLSVFGGDIRIYLPGFAEDTNPYGDHDILLSETLLTARGKEKISAQLRWEAAAESIRRLRLGHDVLSYTQVKQRIHATQMRFEQEGASQGRQLSAAHEEFKFLKKESGAAQELIDQLSDEKDTLVNRARTAEAKLRVANSRIQQLVEQIKTRGEDPDANITLPTSWDKFADWCDLYLGERVQLSPGARRQVKAPKFKDIDAATRCLLWLANEYRERRLKGGDGDIRTTIESGIQNAPCGGDAFKIKWGGRWAQVAWHIKNGNTRDPVRCLRIYYFWDETSQQVVIAEMPAHRRTNVT